MEYTNEDKNQQDAEIRFNNRASFQDFTDDEFVDAYLSLFKELAEAPSFHEVGLAEVVINEIILLEKKRMVLINNFIVAVFFLLGLATCYVIANFFPSPLLMDLNEWIQQHTTVCFFTIGFVLLIQLADHFLRKQSVEASI